MIKRKKLNILNLEKNDRSRLIKKINTSIHFYFKYQKVDLRFKAFSL